MLPGDQKQRMNPSLLGIQQICCATHPLCNKFVDRFYLVAEKNPALKNSRFIRAMLEMEISLGHSASHSLSLEQFPKQSSSIFRTMARARWAASGLP